MAFPHICNALFQNEFNLWTGQIIELMPCKDCTAKSHFCNQVLRCSTWGSNPTKVFIAQSLDNNLSIDLCVPHKSAYMNFLSTLSLECWRDSFFCEVFIPDIRCVAKSHQGSILLQKRFDDLPGRLEYPGRVYHQNLSQALGIIWKEHIHLQAQYMKQLKICTSTAFTSPFLPPFLYSCYMTVDRRQVCKVQIHLIVIHSWLNYAQAPFYTGLKIGNQTQWISNSLNLESVSIKYLSTHLADHLHVERTCLWEMICIRLHLMWY